MDEQGTNGDSLRHQNKLARFLFVLNLSSLSSFLHNKSLLSSLAVTENKHVTHSFSINVTRFPKVHRTNPFDTRDLKCTPGLAFCLSD